MTDLDSNVKNPLNVNKYNLLKVVTNTTGLTENDQFDLMCDLNDISKFITNDVLIIRLNKLVESHIEALMGFGDIPNVVSISEKSTKKNN